MSGCSEAEQRKMPAWRRRNQASKDMQQMTKKHLSFNQFTSSKAIPPLRRMRPLEVNEKKNTLKEPETGNRKEGIRLYACSKHRGGTEIRTQFGIPKNAFKS